jgi:transposase
MCRPKWWPRTANWCACIRSGVDDVARYKNEIHALLVVVFPEFTQVFADPSRPTALALLKLYPNAQAVAAAGVETLAHQLHALSPRHYGRATAEQLVSLAQQSMSSGLAIAARSTSLRILCDQLEHTLANLASLEKEMEQLIIEDPKTKGLETRARIWTQNCSGAASRTRGY